MKSKFIPFIIASVICVSVFSTDSADAKTDLTVDNFASLPETQMMSLSPSGDRIAMVRNLDGTLVLMAHDLKNGQRYMIGKSDNKEAFLKYYTWANDDVILVHLATAKRNRQVRYMISRLMRFDFRDAEKGLQPVVEPRKKAQGRWEHNAQFQDNIISLMPHDPDHILMAIDYDVPNHPTVYRVNVTNKRRKKILGAKEDIVHWHADLDGDIRLGYGFDDTRVFYRLYEKGSKDFRIAWEYEVFSENEVNVLGFDKDPNIVYISAYHEGRKALFKVDLSTKDLKRELIFSDPEYDFDGRILYSYKDGRAIGFSHSNLDNSRHYWDKDYLKLQRGLEKALPDSDSYIIGMNRTEDKYVLFNEADTSAGDYFLGNRKNGSLAYISSTYPKINETNYPPREFVSFKARDGVEIEGYLSLPFGYEKGTQLPAIVFPHGGPMARNYSGFDFWAQSLANQGYAVIQPNFRGSSGYGFNFEAEAVGGFSQTMQTDLADAANWLVKSGYADKNRICIGGASYGGYASLVAAYKQTDIFKCAASFAPVTDLEMLVSNSRRFTNSKVVRKQFGDDDDKLEQSSPVNFAEDFKIPVLIVHGSEDIVVPVKHSREMVDELEDADKKFTYIELEEGNHHLSHQAHRMTTLKAFADFFSQHLK